MSKPVHEVKVDARALERFLALFEDDVNDMDCKKINDARDSLAASLNRYALDNPEFDDD